MSSESLESRLDMSFAQGAKSFGTIDLYAGRETALYTPPPLSIGYDIIGPLSIISPSPYISPWEKPWETPYEPKIIPIDNGIVIPHPKIPGIGIDLHDTYKIDRYNNLYDGHTTINLPNNDKLRFYHDKK